MNKDEFLDEMRTLLLDSERLAAQRYTVQSPGEYGVRVDGVGNLALYVNRKLVAHVNNVPESQTSTLSITLHLEKGDTLGVVGELSNIHAQAVATNPRFRAPNPRFKR